MLAAVQIIYLLFMCIRKWVHRVPMCVFLCPFVFSTLALRPGLVPRSLYLLPGTLHTFLWSGEFHRSLIIFFCLSELRRERYFCCLDFAGNAGFQDSPEAG